MAKLKINAVVGEGMKDFIDVEGNASPSQITEIYINIITKLVEFKDEDEFCKRLDSLIVSSVNNPSPIGVKA